MIVNGVIISKDKNKNIIGKGLSNVKRGNRLSNVKRANGLKFVKGSWPKNFKIKKRYIYIMTAELNQIINLVKSKNEKVENISYKEVNKLELNPENNSSTSLVFNTQSIISSKLIDYTNAYFQFIFDIKFESDAACTKENLTLKNSYEMIQELKIELNNKIISNEHNTNYSYIVNHILENSKNDDLIYRNIDIHSDVVKYNDTNKDVFMTKNGDTMRVICNVFLKDISNFYKNLSIPLEFAEFDLTLKLADEIYVTDQNNVTQTLISSHLYVIKLF